jgi:hypothetical protein
MDDPLAGQSHERYELFCYCFKAGLDMCGVEALLGTTVERAVITGVY